MENWTWRETMILARASAASILYAMKATLEIPDPLYNKAKVRATAFGQTMREFLVTLLQREVERPIPDETGEKDVRQTAVYSSSPDGFLIFNRSADRPVVTDAFVNQMRLEQGI